MNTIKGTPAYWKRFLFEVLAMVKQLGLPTFFMTLTCADLRWNELVSIISKLNGLNLSEDDIKNLDYRITSNKRPTSRKRLPRINAPLFSRIIL